jgi:hypothetical protein
MVLTVVSFVVLIIVNAMLCFGWLPEFLQNSHSFYAQKISDHYKTTRCHNTENL